MGHTHYLTYDQTFLTQHHQVLVKGVTEFLCDAWQKGLINENTFEKKQPIPHFLGYLKRNDSQGLAQAFGNGEKHYGQIFLPTGCESFALDAKSDFVFCKTFKRNAAAEDDLVVAICFLIKSLAQKKVDFDSDGQPADLLGGAEMFMLVKQQLPYLDEKSPSGTNTSEFLDELEALFETVRSPESVPQPVEQKKSRMRP